MGVRRFQNEDGTLTSEGKQRHKTNFSGKASKQLKRKLNNSEWVTIERRKGSGETLAEILNDMNVLKR